MAPEPQRDLEQALLAYKQRRREQAGPPLDLHPATRKMLQSEAARTASRPLLTSEEAAKNFVRSFVMSNQQPGFFARHKQRVIWGGAMFACLAVVLAVLRNDPRQTEQKRLFSDQLPGPPPAVEPPPAQPRPTVVASRPAADSQSATQAKPSAPAAATPLPVVQRESRDRRSVAAAPLPPASPIPGNARGANPAAPIAAPAAAKSANVFARDADKELTEQRAAGEGMQLAKALKASEAAGVKAIADEFKVKSVSREQNLAANLAGVAGGADNSPAAAPAAVSSLQRLGAPAVADLAPVRQRFQQLDNRAGYRQNFNSPPVPQVMQDFAFERTGDRVRIVDADGSTYEGTVTPALAEESGAKSLAKLDVAEKRKDATSQQAQSADTQLAYRFYANGVNRKLNQSVEFRGEWLPAESALPALATPALQPTSYSGVRLELQAADKKEKASPTNALSDPLPLGQNYLPQQSQKEQSPGRISGRAVVGGKSEFDIKAVPR